MMLFVNGVSQGVQCTHVGYWVENYESAFEILTELIADDWTLQEATIVDGHDRMAIPVEVFDGQPMQVHIEALQREWQQILSTPPALPDQPVNQPLKVWYEQLDAYYEQMLVHLEKMIWLLELRKSKLKKSFNESLRQQLTEQYDSLLDANRSMYWRTKANREKNRIWLSKFENK